LGLAYENPIEGVSVHHRQVYNTLAMGLFDREPLDIVGGEFRIEHVLPTGY